MAIDDPLEQALAQIEAEKRDTNPMIQRLPSARQFLKFGVAASKAVSTGSLSDVVSALSGVADFFARDRSQYLHPFVAPGCKR